jgi:hypothetical protein
VDILRRGRGGQLCGLGQWGWTDWGEREDINRIAIFDALGRKLKIRIEPLTKTGTRNVINTIVGSHGDGKIACRNFVELRSKILEVVLVFQSAFPVQMVGGQEDDECAHPDRRDWGNRMLESGWDPTQVAYPKILAKEEIYVTSLL